MSSEYSKIAQKIDKWTWKWHPIEPKCKGSKGEELMLPCSYFYGGSLILFKAIIYDIYFPHKNKTFISIHDLIDRGVVFLFCNPKL